jgi:hypothetical protein
MESRWKKKISEFLEMIPPLRGGDFQGIAGLSSDDSLLVGVNSARAKFYECPRAAKHRLDEPGQIIPQHGCVPALPASVSPGSGNSSRTSTKVVRAAQNQASVIAHRGLEVKLQFYASGRGRNIFLTFPFIDQDITTVDDARPADTLLSHSLDTGQDRDLLSMRSTEKSLGERRLYSAPDALACSFHR